MQQLALTEKNQITKIGLKIVKSQEIMNEILLKIKRAQQEFDKQIYLKSGVEWKWNSIINIERLKLCLLVEVGEFANELKTFKIWHKKQDL